MMNPPRFSFYTLGCKVNQYETQALTEQLQAHGLILVEPSEPCDLLLLNTCAVTAESLRKARQMTRRAHKLHPNAGIVVMGCASQMEPDTFSSLPGVFYLCGTRNKNSVINQILSYLDQKKEQALPCAQIDPPCGEIENMTITHFDRTRAYVKIQDGCSGKCTYCIISKLRGPVASKRPEAVIEEVKGLVAGGCREVVLTGIETSAYEYDLPALLEALNDLEGLDRIRLGSLDPSFMRHSLVDRIAPLSKLAPHYHLSLQSGSDCVLNRMKRRYGIKMALDHIGYMKALIPGVQFSTDIIVGFPGETDEDFAQTLNAVSEIGFLHVHVFPFSPRPGTEAANYIDRVPETVKNQRASALINHSERIRDRILNTLVEAGKPLKVLVETEGESGYLTGHSDCFAEVSFACNQSIDKLRGQTVTVQPVAANNGIITGIMI